MRVPSSFTIAVTPTNISPVSTIQNTPRRGLAAGGGVISLMARINPAIAAGVEGARRN